MRKLLFSSLILVACGTSEVSVNTTSETDSTEVGLNDSLSITKDSVRAITHGSPEQEKLDSIKKAKQEQKK